MDRFATLRDGLVGAWCPSLRTGGYLIEDRSNRRNNGDMIGGSDWSAGVLRLTRASSGYVNAMPAALAGSLFGSQMSVSAWIRPTTIAQGTLLTVASTIQSVGQFGNFYMWMNSTGGRLHWSQSGSAIDATTSASLTANAWHFVCGTRAGSAGAWTVTLTINNTTQTFSVGGNPNATTGRLVIGRPGDFNGNYFDGLIDDVRAWNRPLTLSEINLLASQPRIGLTATRHRRANVLGSQFWLRDAGTWKKATGWIKVNGVWTKATPKIRVSGAYK